MLLCGISLGYLSSQFLGVFATGFVVGVGLSVTEGSLQANAFVQLVLWWFNHFLLSVWRLLSWLRGAVEIFRSEVSNRLPVCMVLVWFGSLTEG